MRLYEQATDEVPSYWKEKYESHAARYWDTFYKRNQTNFFSDRHWLVREFPMLAEKDLVVLEVGCGVGNTTIPLSQINETAVIHSCDYADTAVQLLRKHPEFQSQRMSAFVADITKDDLLQHVPAHSVDVVTCIFVLSANSMEQLGKAVHNLRQVLKPGTGRVLVRDYAVGDLSEERFAAEGKQKKLSCNFFVRGDGTRCLYFSEAGLCDLFEAHGFSCEKMHVRESTIENRKQNIAMHRRWIQAEFRLSDPHLREQSDCTPSGASEAYTAAPPPHPIHTSSTDVAGMRMLLRAGTEVLPSEMELALWMASRPPLLREKSIVDLGSGVSCACAFAAVRHCRRYTYACPSTEQRADMQQQWSINSAHVIAERACFALLAPLLAEGRSQPTAVHRLRDASGSLLPSQDCRATRQRSADIFDVVVVRVTAGVTVSGALEQAQTLTTAQGVAVLVNEQPMPPVPPGVRILCSGATFSVLELFRNV